MWKNIFKFSWRNIWRNRRRTAFTLAAIIFGLISLIFMRSYVAGFMNSFSETMVKTETGHIRLAHKEFLRLERIMPKEHLISGLNRIKAEIAELPEVDLVFGRIKFNVLLNHGDRNEPALVIGVDPAAVDKSMNLSKAMASGKYFDSKGLNLIIGKKLAAELDAEVDDELLLVTSDINFSTYALPFRIAGMFEFGMGSYDKHLLYIPLQKAQEMLDCGDAAHEMLIFLKDPAQSHVVAEKVTKILGQSDPKGDIRIIPWQEHDMIATMVPLMENVFQKITGLIMFIVALVILNTMLMAVMERYHEIGVIKAMGFKNRETFLMILTEAFYMGVIGSAIGGILGGSLSGYLEKIGIDLNALSDGLMGKIDMPFPFLGSRLYPDLTPEMLISSMTFGLVVALIAVLYPAYKSAKMGPVEAFRSELKV